MHALIDANVFVSVRTLDVVLSFAQAHLFEVSWSKAIEDEAVRAVGRLRPDAAAATRRMIDNANRAFPFARVELPRSFDHHALPDPDDEHVLAAAIACGADAIATYNVKDFPPDVMDEFGLAVLHPDELLLAVMQENPAVATWTLEKLVANKRRPPITMVDELAMLERNGLRGFASAVRACL